MTATVHANINYIAPMEVQPKYHANDYTKDILEMDIRSMEIVNARSLEDPPRFEREGFVLVRHESAVENFTDSVTVAQIHPQEIKALVKEVTGADEVLVTSPGLLRFGEKSGKAGSLNNSRPARFAHVDVSPATAEGMAKMIAPEGKKVRRFTQVNVWRALTPGPQDVPLALCDVRSVKSADLVSAEAVFDEPGKPRWSFEGLVVGHNPGHRWMYYRDMNRDEVLVFNTYDSEKGQAIQVPHVAFDDPSCPADAVPRASIEMRATAFWYDD
ncbi:CmcJ/NvfI family oxidoreductase [Emcibacter sp.]|uniref:CmcJ/NvfI family oxidoreductase n=1 Tax=Emcibacter sp. TaxID=1979954 RepID=UPI002AA93CC0|nr:CmcJ/NvfI family oxidoreductase [Emcibacter sp.]